MLKYLNINCVLINSSFPKAIGWYGHIFIIVRTIYYDLALVFSTKTLLTNYTPIAVYYTKFHKMN